jgi:hypothetical protein
VLFKGNEGGANRRGKAVGEDALYSLSRETGKGLEVEAF